MCRVPHRKMRTVEPSSGPLKGTKESIPGKMVRVSLKPVVVGLRPILKLFTAVSDQIIWRVLGRTYIYNVSWEDPRIDQREFMLTEDDHVITLASAGDNALDYVIEGAKVSAVDFNSCQIALCELKAAVVKNLSWEDTFAIFGRSDIARLRSHYHNNGLRDDLSEKSQKFWDKRLRKDFNFMYSGTSGLAAWGLVHLILPFLGLGFIRRLVMKGVSKVKPVLLEDPLVILLLIVERAHELLSSSSSVLQLRDILPNLFIDDVRVAGVDGAMTY